MVPFGVVAVKIKVLNFLNPNVMSDALLKDGEIWDCYGKKQSIEDSVIFIWKTRSWKHAFYMASCLSLEYSLNSLVVRVNGSPENRSYELFVTRLEEEKDKNGFVAALKSDGFSQSKIIYPTSPVGKQRVDRLTK